MSITDYSAAISSLDVHEYDLSGSNEDFLKLTMEWEVKAGQLPHHQQAAFLMHLGVLKEQILEQLKALSTCGLSFYSLRVESYKALKKYETSAAALFNSTQKFAEKTAQTTNHLAAFHEKTLTMELEVHSGNRCFSLATYE